MHAQYAKLAARDKQNYPSPRVTFVFNARLPVFSGHLSTQTIGQAVQYSPAPSGLCLPNSAEDTEAGRFHVMVWRHAHHQLFFIEVRY
jgi:hypothetical protein